MLVRGKGCAISCLFSIYIYPVREWGCEEKGKTFER